MNDPQPGNRENIDSDGGEAAIDKIGELATERGAGPLSACLGLSFRRGSRSRNP